MNISLGRWLGMRVDILGAFIILLVRDGEGGANQRDDMRVDQTGVGHRRAGCRWWTV